MQCQSSHRFWLFLDRIQRQDETRPPKDVSSSLIDWKSLTYFCPLHFHSIRNSNNMHGLKINLSKDQLTVHNNLKLILKPACSSSIITGLYLDMVERKHVGICYLFSVYIPTERLSFIERG